MPGRLRQTWLRTATPMLNAVAAVANHACLRHQLSALSSRRLRRTSRAVASLRGLNSLGSRLLRSSIDPLRASFVIPQGAPLRRSRQFTPAMGNGSDHPAVLTREEGRRDYRASASSLELACPVAQARRGKRVCAVAEQGLRNAENEEVEGILPATVGGGK